MKAAPGNAEPQLGAKPSHAKLGLGAPSLPPGYKQTDVGAIPEEWEVESMDSLTSRMTNGIVGTATSAYVSSDDGVLYIQGYNVQEGSFPFRLLVAVSAPE